MDIKKWDFKIGTALIYVTAGCDGGIWYIMIINIYVSIKLQTFSPVLILSAFYEGLILWDTLMHGNLCVCECRMSAAVVGRMHIHRRIDNVAPSVGT